MVVTGAAHQPGGWQTAASTLMQIWVDADACPVVIRDILFRAAERTGVTMTLVANKPVRLPLGRNLHFVQVPPGFDAADQRIVELMSGGDLVITADVPLGCRDEKGGTALNPRGELYTRGTCPRALVRS